MFVDKSTGGRVFGNEQIQAKVRTERFEEVVSDKVKLQWVKVTNGGEIPIHLNAIEVGEYRIKGRVREILHNGWGQSSFSGYVKPGTVSKRFKWFLKRDQNPFSFEPKYGYLKGSLVNEWYSQIVGTTRIIPSI